MSLKHPLTLGTLLSLAITLNTQAHSVAYSERFASLVEQNEDSPALSVSEETHTASSYMVRPRKKTATPLRRVISNAAAKSTYQIAQKSSADLAMLPSIDRSDANMNHKRIANEALHMLPEKCRGTLVNFYVKYEKQQHRGLAGKSVMILDGTVKKDGEFRALFIHESGHNWDLGCFTGTQDAGKSSFSDGDEAIYKDDASVGFYQISWITSEAQRSDSRPEDFVSGYASYDIFEDFAESFAYFVLHNEEFAERAQTNKAIAKKYAWILNNVFDRTVPQIATGKAPFEGKVPWDITKLAYAWHPELSLAQR